MSSTLMQSNVHEWLRLDKNPITRAEIQSLLKSGSDDELRRRMEKRIEFGTAGLRGRMEPGFSRMNDVTIIQASQGLCSYVLREIPDAKTNGVVVGHDHRHNSERWAFLATRAFLSNGVKVYLHRGLVHTPLVPFSVSQLQAACGVMITASHNPKNDNGYKVYWQNAVQIIEPHDAGIAQAIHANLEPGPDAWDVDDILDSPLCVDKTDEMVDLYFEELAKLSRTHSLNAATKVKFVTTAMHGVGHRFTSRAADMFGLKTFIPVEAQLQPDPEFPTVPFPNPEEKGALDLAMATADSEGAQYVLAVDPDADRFAAAEKQLDGRWVQFTGDQLGALFASSVLEAYKSSGKPLGKLAMVASTVSSKIVQTMAKAEGFQFAECLTGFKWIGNIALSLEAEGFDAQFGYEEAIGFMFGRKIRDKDGVAAMMKFAELVVSSHAEGKTISKRLDIIYERYGYHQTQNSYFICRDPAVITQIFEALRHWPTPDNLPSKSTNATYPRLIGGLSVDNVRDLTLGSAYDSQEPDFKPSLPVTGGEMITFKLSGHGVDVVMTLRTSGTEPKIKYYIEGRGGNKEKVGRCLNGVVRELRDSWMRAKEHGLGEP